MTNDVSQLLLDHLDLITEPAPSLPVLDLACGTGRNGLLLAKHGVPVVFADRSCAALDVVREALSENTLPGQTWQVDLEQTTSNPLAGLTFSAIIGFRYLHRPLFPAIKNAIQPGGLVIYETFTITNRRFGRPANPDFLLRCNELKTEFQDWELIYHYEGIRPDPDRGIAQIIARKPGKLQKNHSS